MSLAEPEGRPVAKCSSCGQECGVVRVDVGSAQERELLVDLEHPRYAPMESQDVLVWVEMFSGHPPEGRVLPMGALHASHRCSHSHRREHTYVVHDDANLVAMDKTTHERLHRGEDPHK